MANLWTEFAAHHVYAMATNGKERETLSESLVAATFEKARTYVFAVTQVWDPEGGSSNPLSARHFQALTDRSNFAKCGDFRYGRF